MDPPKKQITARLPELLYIGALEKSKEKGISFTDVLIDALEKYLGDDLPGLCPICHTQNLPNAKFCSECSTQLKEHSEKIGIPIPKALESYIKNQQDKQLKLEKKIEELDLEMTKVLKMAQIIGKYQQEHGEEAFNSIPTPRKKLEQNPNKSSKRD